MVEVGLIIAVIVALNEVIKRSLGISSKYLPITSLTLGLVAGFLYLDGELKERLFYGLIIGLSASGLFDQTKLVTKKGDIK